MTMVVRTIGGLMPAYSEVYAVRFAYSALYDARPRGTLAFPQAPTP